MIPKTQTEQAIYGIGKEKGGKNQTSSKRLRNVFYLLYQQDNKTFTTFDEYYESQMENIINKFKAFIIEENRAIESPKTKEDKQSEVTKKDQVGVVGTSETVL